MAHLLLRIGVAFAFLYPPFNALSNPDSWIGYFPPFIHGIGGMSDIFLLHVFGVIEVIIALWILSGKYIVIPSVLASVILLSIVGFNYFNFEVLFRDVSIAAASLALAVTSYRSTFTSSLLGADKI